jgi:hypothetical protein
MAVNLGLAEGEVSNLRKFKQNGKGGFPFRGFPFPSSASNIYVFRLAKSLTRVACNRCFLPRETMSINKTLHAHHS